MNSNVKERNIGLAIFFSIITCGLYGIYWFIVLTNDANRGSGNENNNLSGGVSFLLTLVTCSLYGIYWAYAQGKSIKVANDKFNIKADDNSILYLLLQLFGLSIVGHAIMQSEINKIARAESNPAVVTSQI